MSETGNGNLFHVEASGKVLGELNAIRLRAKKAGKGQRFLAALRAIHDRLQKNPKEFGEPLFRLPALKIVVYVGIVNPLVVQYGVHEEKPLVLLRGINDISK